MSQITELITGLKVDLVTGETWYQVHAKTIDALHLLATKVETLEKRQRHPVVSELMPLAHNPEGNPCGFCGDSHEHYHSGRTIKESLDSLTRELQELTAKETLPGHLGAVPPLAPKGRDEKMPTAGTGQLPPTLDQETKDLLKFDDWWPDFSKETRCHTSIKPTIRSAFLGGANSRDPIVPKGFVEPRPSIDDLKKPDPERTWPDPNLKGIQSGFLQPPASPERQEQAPIAQLIQEMRTVLVSYNYREAYGLIAKAILFLEQFHVQWRDASKEKPEAEGDYLVEWEYSMLFMAGKTIGVMRYDGKGWDCQRTILNWMPIPPLPKEEK